MNVAYDPFDHPLKGVSATPEIEETFLRLADAPEHEYVTPSVGHRSFRRLRWFGICIVVVLITKLLSVQITQTEWSRGWAVSNRARVVLEEGNRGAVTDRNGIVLISNTPSFSLYITPAELQGSGQNADTVLTKLIHDFDLSSDSATTVLDHLNSQASNSIPLNAFLSYDQAVEFIVHEATFPGVHLDIRPTRLYHVESSPSLSHVLGYIGRPTSAEVKSRSLNAITFVGRSGIEKSLDDQLRGVPGKKEVEYDARGRARRVLQSTEPTDGTTVRLTIDAELQTASEKSLKAILREKNSHFGSVIVLDPRNGEVLALVSLPTFDSNVFTQPRHEKDRVQLLANTQLPLFDRAISGQYPSGSTVKPLYAAIALDQGAITPTSSVLSTGGIRSGAWFFPDWKTGGHGRTDVYKALSESVNTYFYALLGGEESVVTSRPFKNLGIETAMKGLERFGWGSPTGIELSEEASGFLPTPQWKERVRHESWYIGDTYHVAIGQGDLLVTPLQLAQSTAVFANGGFKVTPHLLANNPPRERLRVISHESVQTILRAMQLTVKQGSGRRLQGFPFDIAAKTGTAQTNQHARTNSWLTSFAPANAPEVVVIAHVEQGGEGSDAALSVVKSVYTWWTTHRFRRLPTPISAKSG